MANFPHWDQRPGELEATRREPDSGLLVTGSRARGDTRGGWMVLVTVRGEDGCFTQVSLPTEEARAFGAELIRFVELLDGRIW